MNLRHAVRRIIKSKVHFPGLYNFLKRRSNIVVRLNPDKEDDIREINVDVYGSTIIIFSFTTSYPVTKINIHTMEAPGGKFSIPCNIDAHKFVEFWVTNKDRIVPK